MIFIKKTYKGFTLSFTLEFMAWQRWRWWWWCWWWVYFVIQGNPMFSMIFNDFQCVDFMIQGNPMFSMLHDANFTYDSSMPIYENKVISNWILEREIVWRNWVTKQFQSNFITLKHIKTSEECQKMLIKHAGQAIPKIKGKSGKNAHGIQKGAKMHHATQQSLTG